MHAPQTKNAKSHINNGLLWYSFPALDAYADRLAHGFSTRIGGVSEGSLASLNLGTERGEDLEKVKENYRRFGQAAGFDPTKAVFSWQTHDNKIREATKEDAGKGLFRPRDYQGVDGLITKEKGLPLVTHYADCTPLFFYAPDKHIAASSHAGWRGTAKRIAAATIDEFVSRGCNVEDLVAVIGPSAGPLRYEVDGECAEAFKDISDEKGQVLSKVSGKKGKYLLDIWRANKSIMINAGMLANNISISGLCTITHNDIFYSYRIMGNERGALAGFVMLK